MHTCHPDTPKTHPRLTQVVVVALHHVDNPVFLALSAVHPPSLHVHGTEECGKTHADRHAAEFAPTRKTKANPCCEIGRNAERGVAKRSRRRLHNWKMRRSAHTVTSSLNCIVLIPARSHMHPATYTRPAAGILSDAIRDHPAQNHPLGQPRQRSHATDGRAISSPRFVFVTRRLGIHCTPPPFSSRKWASSFVRRMPRVFVNCTFFWSTDRTRGDGVVFFPRRMAVTQ